MNGVCVGAAAGVVAEAPKVSLDEKASATPRDMTKAPDALLVMVNPPIPNMNAS